MNAPAVTNEVDSYISAVERLLDDLPDEDRRDLIDGVREHVTEVAAEDEGSLTERLGPPERYAAELRASAGLPAYVPREELTAAERLRRRVAASPLAAVGNSAPVRFVRGFMPELRPTWWVVRGYLAAVVASAALGDRLTDGPPWPTVDGSWVAGLALLAVCVALSILAGRATANRQRWLGIAVAANLVIVALFIGALPRSSVGPTASIEMVGADPFGFLRHGDGAPVTHICAYDEDGKRLKDVQLYDQMGRPIVGSARERRELLSDRFDLPGEKGAFIREKLLRAPGGGEDFECPKELEDLQERGDAFAVPRMQRIPGVPPIPRGPRAFIVE